MKTVLLVGAGRVGSRAARQLVDTPGVDRVLVASRRVDRAAALARVLGPAAEPVVLARTQRDGVPPVAGALDGDGVHAVAVAMEPTSAAPWPEVAAKRGVPVAVVGPTEGSARRRLEEIAIDRGIAVVTGCGLAPGLSDVLARHAAGLFDVVDEVHVARAGAEPGACADAVREARRATPGEWRDGAWRTDRAFGPELVWFPDPVGARECQLVCEGVAATVATVPAVRHATVRLGPPPVRSRWRRWLRRDPLDQGWGAVRVELTGWRGGATDSVVYGVVDRPSVVAGAVVAVTAAALAGIIDAGIDRRAGIHALGEVVAPVAFLAELARRGVRAAVFEGVVPAT